MPIFFAGSNGTAVGRTVACADMAASGTMRFLGLDPTLNYSQHRSIITRMSYSHQGNYQFLHTMGNDVYIYVYGDRVGQVTIQGLCFASNCSGGGNSSHGIELLDKWYAANRIANRQKPVRVNIGSSWVEGFVIGSTGEMVDPDTRIMGYSLQLATLPKRQ